MIKFENTEVTGWKAAIRGMRNPMNSWEKSDSFFCETGLQPTCSCCEDRHTGRCVNGYIIGENDLKLMKSLSKAGSDHSKFLRMITVTVDITAMQPWWAEFDTYKVGTVRNSCSKMHKIHVKPFELSDFTHEGCYKVDYAYDALLSVIETCEKLRQDFNRTKDKKYWRALIELLPEGYRMRATVQLNYQVLKSMYFARRNHKLDEWCRHKEIISDADSTSQAKYSKSYKEYFGFCDWIETLPYSELITGEIE